MFNMTNTNTNNQTKGDGDLEGARRATGKSPSEKLPTVDPEVVVKPERRNFTTAYKLSILKQADQCKGAGEIGMLLRREGLYSSHLSNWRRLRQKGILIGLSHNKRGPKANSNTAHVQEVSRLKKKILRLEKELNKAHTIIDVQKKLSEILNQIQTTEITS